MIYPEKDKYHPVRMVICKGCGHRKKNHAKGYCDLCYNNLRTERKKSKKDYQPI